jgi:hypothetical protein
VAEACWRRRARGSCNRPVVIVLLLQILLINCRNYLWQILFNTANCKIIAELTLYCGRNNAQNRFNIKKYDGRKEMIANFEKQWRPSDFEN